MSKLSANSSLPLLLESDVLSLAPGFTVRHGSVLDIQVGALHQIHGAGVHIVQALEHKVQYGLLQHIAHEHAVSPQSLATLLAFLHSMGGLMRQRPLLTHLEALKITCSHGLVGGRFAALRRRYPLRFFWLGVALLRACIPLSIATACTALLLVGLGLLAPSLILLCCAGGLTLFWLSLIVHEGSHIVAANICGARCGLLQYGMHVATLRRKLPARQELFVALSGPLLGVHGCLLIAVVLWGFGYVQLAYIAALVGGFHMLSLLPWTTDGKIVYSSWQMIRQEQL